VNISEAYIKAVEEGETCIVRSIGLMKFRFLQPTKGYGCLKADQLSPVSGLKVQKHYSLLPDDITATNWDVARDKELSEGVSGDDKETDPSNNDMAEAAIDTLYDRIRTESLSTTLLEMVQSIKILTEISGQKSKPEEGSEKG
jgi:hypothetical protein